MTQHPIDSGIIQVDATHNPQLRSWVASAQGHADFPIQNLPLGVFSPAGKPPRISVAIGDSILDLNAAAKFLPANVGELVAVDDLNVLFAAGASVRKDLRRAVQSLLADTSTVQSELAACLHRSRDCQLHLPAIIGDYTDFYVGINHATNVGKLFRPDQPLMPNYKWVPIGYHGRASTVRPSGVPVRRPNGQRKKPDEAVPTFGPCRNLDYELEIGIWVGQGSEPEDQIAIATASQHIAGYSLLNDWSARDIQAWEYQPLGPFLAKSFATTVSPWVVTPEALAPFRIAQSPRPDGDPAPLEYLNDPIDQSLGAFDIELEVWIVTPSARAAGMPPHRLASSNTRHMYWTPAQLIAHHTSNGCKLRPGDLLGSGTISGPTVDSFGSLLETTSGGKHRITLPGGETRGFLEDGDEIILRARAHRDGNVSIGFGECRAVIQPTREGKIS
jgi:fumarylacetoacetase